MAYANNPYNGRWRWWYPAIADWMIRNPDGKMVDCARELGKHVNTISMIVNTDLYKDYLAKRRQEWQQTHDHALQAKLTKVAGSALDILHDVLEKKRDQVPIGQLKDIGISALDRLGYSPNKAQTPGLTVVSNGGQVNVMPVPLAAIQEAQAAIRAAQAKRIAGAAVPVVSNPEDEPSDLTLDLTAERSDESGVDAAVEPHRALGSDN